MKNLVLVLSITLFFFASCSKDQSEKMDCIASKLEEANMVPYNGQDIGCKFYLELFEFQNEQYFILGSHCIDMYVSPTDCAGNILCEDVQSSDCQNFFIHSTNLGIIGFSGE